VKIYRKLSLFLKADLAAGLGFSLRSDSFAFIPYGIAGSISSLTGLRPSENPLSCLALLSPPSVGRARQPAARCLIGPKQKIANSLYRNFLLGQLISD
jgi:hypothetical protein